MTTEKASALKVDAENNIIDILNALEKETGCDVTRIEFRRVTEEVYCSFGQGVDVRKTVDIILTIK